MSSIDTLITGDLGALRDDSRRQLVPIEDALRTTHMYRDDRPGAEGRRDAVVEERRRELVMMPLTLSHVFAHRVGRAAAGAGALACALVMMAMLADPLLMRFAAWLVPGLNVGMLCMLTVLAIVGCYVVATWIAEAWFARRMRSAIATSTDAYADLEQLGRGPIDIAQQAIHRVDALSLGLFLSGMTAIALVFGYVIVIVGAFHELAYAWSITGVLGTGALERNLGVLIFTVMITTTLSYLVARGCRRESQSLLVRALSHWAAVPVALIFGLTSAYGGFHMLMSIRWRRDPISSDERYLAVSTAAIGLMIAVTWVVLWWRRREQARIDV